MNKLKIINQLKPIDLNCSIFSVYDYDGLSMQELLCQFFTKINEIIEEQNKVYDLVDWLVNKGLKEEVAKKLKEWLNDGTLATIINETIFQELNNKITEIGNKFDYVTIEEFGVNGDEIENDTINLQKAINFACSNRKKLKSLSNKVITINRPIYINKNFYIDFNGTTLKSLSESCLIIDIPSSTNEDTQSYIKNLYVDCSNNQKGISIIAKRCYLSNIYFKNINNIGLSIDGGYEVTVSNCNFRGISPTNKAIVVNTTDIYIHHCFGTDNNVFIENNADGNIFESCHAWILTPNFLTESIFINFKVSGIATNCVSDTYYISFRCNAIGTTRLINNNSIIHAGFYNSSTYNKPPVFCFIYGGNYVHKMVIRNNWVSYPSTDITGFENVGYFINIPKENFYGFMDGNTGHEVDFYSTLKKEVEKEEINITQVKSYVIRKDNRVHFRGYFAFNERIPNNDTKIFTLPDGFRPYKNLTSFCGIGINRNNISKVCTLYINSDGVVMVNNTTGDETMAQGVIDITFDIWDGATK